MSQGITRSLLILGTTLVLGVALYVGAILFVAGVLGQAECDKGECSWVGEVVLGESRYIGLASCLLIAAALAWLLSHQSRRIARRHPVER